MKNKTNKQYRQLTTRHYPRVMTFVVCLMLLCAILGFVALIISGIGASGHPYGAPAFGTGVSELQKMNGGTALPLLFGIILLLVGCGVLYAVRDSLNTQTQ